MENFRLQIILFQIRLLNEKFVKRHIVYFQIDQQYIHQFLTRSYNPFDNGLFQITALIVRNLKNVRISVTLHADVVRSLNKANVSEWLSDGQMNSFAVITGVRK